MGYGARVRSLACRRGRAAALLCLVLFVAALAGACTDSGGDNGSGTGGATSTSAATGSGDGTEDGAFVSAEGRFRVVLPGAPDREVQETPAAGVTLEVVLFTVEDGEDHLYQVAYVDYPESLGELDPDGALDGAANGAANRTGGELVDKERLEYLGQPAIDYTITAGDATVQARTLLVGRRLYTLQAISITPPAPAFEAMLASFRLEP